MSIMKSNDCTTIRSLCEYLELAFVKRNEINAAVKDPPRNKTSFSFQVLNRWIWCNSTHSSLFLQIVVNKVTVVIFVAIVMAYNIFIFILFYSIAVVPYIGMYNNKEMKQILFRSQSDCTIVRGGLMRCLSAVQANSPK